MTVRSIVIAYEDDYCKELHLLIKRLRVDGGQPGLILESATVRGTGGFINEVPKLLRTPLKQTKQPPDRLVCLADADRPKNLSPEAPPAPDANDGAVEQWVLELEKSWRALLVRGASLSDEAAARLRVCCLRWNKESLLVASPEALLDYATKHLRYEQVKALLEGCDPCPMTLADEDFVLRYRKPDGCMDRVLRVIEDRKYKKGRDDDDLLRDQIAPHPPRRAELLRRCPDLRRLLRELV